MSIHLESMVFVVHPCVSMNCISLPMVDPEVPSAMISELRK
jgi:hypothetical protein